MFSAFAIGVGAGLVASLPVAGPISALVFARGIEGRFRAGSYIALGGGLVEAGYAFLAFWGFGTFLAEYPIIVPISQGVGALVLLILGITFIRKQQQKEAPEREHRDTAGGNFATGAWLAAINPTLLATWSGFIASAHGSGLIDLAGPRVAAPMAAGCLVGICGWFLSLMVIIRRFRGRFKYETLARVIRWMGVFLLALSAWFVWQLASYFLAA